MLYEVITDVRKRIAASLTRTIGLPFTGDLVTMTTGAAGALNVALQAILSPGRITSYNVCYTKLLRGPRSSHRCFPNPPPGGRLPDRTGGRPGSRKVPTPESRRMRRRKHPVPRKGSSSPFGQESLDHFDFTVHPPLASLAEVHLKVHIVSSWRISGGRERRNNFV